MRFAIETKVPVAKAEVVTATRVEEGRPLPVGQIG